MHKKWHKWYNEHFMNDRLKINQGPLLCKEGESPPESRTQRLSPAFITAI